MKLILAILFIITYSITIGQINLPTIVPPSPNAAEIGRFESLPVGLFSGTCQYDIPIFNLKNSNLSIPITLKYSSNGLKVDKLSSIVGFDWSLHAGGIINRFRKGKVDSPGPRPSYPDWNSMNAEARLLFMENLKTVSKDLEPDIFSFNFPGYSGKFFFDQQGEVKQIPFSNLSIRTNYSGSFFSFFEITTPEGVKYRFEDVEQSHSSTEPSFFSSWHLTQIIHPSGDTVSFKYTKLDLRQDISIQRTVSVDLINNTQDPQACHSSENIEKIVYQDNSICLLDTVIFNGVGKVIFQKSQNRLDSYLDFKLDKIIITDIEGHQIKAIELFHQFPFGIHSSGTLNNSSQPNNENSYRMFLDSVHVLGSRNNFINRYKFEYYDLDKLPSRFCYSQDHWGYFNGENNNDFVSLDNVTAADQGLFSNSCGSANRNANYNFSMRGMLKKIVFPTKGEIGIEYEANRNSYNEQVGGCRVAKTTTKSDNTTISQIKRYNYPSVLSATPFPKYYQTYPGACTTGVLTSSSLNNLLVDGQYHVCYREVEIWNGNTAEQGKEIQKFHARANHLWTPINGNMIFPLVYSNSGYINGLLFEKQIQNTTNTTKKIEKHIYNFNDHRNSDTIKCLAVNYREYITTPLASHDYFLQFYDVVPYELYANWYYISSTTETEIDDTGNSFSSKKNYEYTDSPYAFVRTETTTTSSGDEIQTKYKYPFDFRYTESTYCDKQCNDNKCLEYYYDALMEAINNNDKELENQISQSITNCKEGNWMCTDTYNNLCIQSITGDNYIKCFNSMRTNHVISPIIEQQTYKITTTLGKQLLSSTFTNYLDKGNSLFVPTNISKIELSNPADDFQDSYVDIDGNLILDDRYNKKEDFQFNTHGKLVQSQLTNNFPTTYIWDETNNYLMAKIDNANYADVGQILGSGFKISSSGFTELQESNLRSNLPNALITTYTYKPLWGMTSQTDVNSSTTHYEYDDYGRLKLIKDHLRQILKKNTYHYSN